MDLASSAVRRERPTVRPLIRRLAPWAVLTVVAGAIGWEYAVAVDGTPALGGAIGLSIGASVVGLELFVVERPVGAPLRRLPLPAFMALTAVAWAALIVLFLWLVPLAFGKDPYGDGYQSSSFGRDFLFALLVSLAFNAIVRVRSLVGTRVLGNFLIGRYYRPLREERVFMFLDLADSTRLSEELGDERVQSLIARFFFDIARPIADHGGEVHRYIGDEVVVTWPLEQAVADARCVACVLSIQAHVARHAPRYEAEFGVVPRFRVGMHGGSVVASEVGDDRREIVYFGDTINTAARLRAVCKHLGREFLISAALLRRLTLPTGVAVDPLGLVELAGKARPMEVVALSRGGTA